MDLRVEDSGDAKVLILNGELTIEHADELKDALAKSLNSAGHVVLNIEGASNVDLSCLQLLCSTHRTAVRSNKVLSLSGGYSGPFKQAVTDLGYFRSIGCSLDTGNTCIWKCLCQGDA